MSLPFFYEVSFIPVDHLEQDKDAEEGEEADKVDVEDVHFLLERMQEKRDRYVRMESKVVIWALSCECVF